MINHFSSVPFFGVIVKSALEDLLAVSQHTLEVLGGPFVAPPRYNPEIIQFGDKFQKCNSRSFPSLPAECRGEIFNFVVELGGVLLADLQALWSAIGVDVWISSLVVRTVFVPQVSVGVLTTPGDQLTFQSSNRKKHPDKELLNGFVPQLHKTNVRQKALDLAKEGQGSSEPTN